MPRTIAISMHDHAHAETHYLCEEANRIQNVLRFRDVYLDRDALTTDERVNGPAALRHFHGLKAAHGFEADDVLAAVVQGNVHDSKYDEYFSISYREYDALKA